MPFHFDEYSDRPVLVNVLDSDFHSDELPAMADEAIAWLSRLDQRVYYIVHLGEIRLTVGDILLGAQLAAQGARPPLHHPNIIEAIVVSTDPLIMMAAKSVDSHLFGHLKLKVFSTIDEALGYVELSLHRDLEE